MNWRNTVGTNGGALLTGLTEPGLANRTLDTASDPAGDWLCAWCLNPVANEKLRFPYDGKDEFTFTNPAGIRFEIITFSQAFGCRQCGTPTLDHTWFPGYAWSFCQCDRCGQHLGWFYHGPRDFVGLVKAYLVRSLHVRN